MKRIIISLLIVSLLNLVGCSYMQQMNPSEVNFAENPDIQLATKDTLYKINGDDYYYNNDTIFATVSKPLDKNSYLKYKISIPVEKIDSLEVKKVDVGATVLLIAVTGLVVFGIALMWALSHYQLTDNPTTPPPIKW